MKASVVILSKFSSLLLIGALSFILLELLRDIFFSNTPGDGSMIAAALLVIIPLANNLFTIHFCNSVLSEEIIQSSPIKNGAFLVSAIISFMLSIVVLMVVAGTIMDVIEEGMTTSFSNRSIRDIILFLSVIVFSVLGSIAFFLQLYVRKVFLSKVKRASVRLVDSIGSSHEN